MKICILLITLFVSLFCIAKSSELLVYKSEYQNWGYLNEITNENYSHFEDTSIILGYNGSLEKYHPFWGFEIDWSDLSGVTIVSATFNAYALTSVWSGDIYLSNNRGNSISAQPRGSAIQGMNNTGRSITMRGRQWSSVDLTDELSNYLASDTLNALQIVVYATPPPIGFNGNNPRIGNDIVGNSAYLEISFTSIPEPSASTLIFGGAILGLTICSRKRAGLKRGR